MKNDFRFPLWYKRMNLNGSWITRNPYYNDKGRKVGRYWEYERLLRKYRKRHIMEKWSTESYTEEKREYRRRQYIMDSYHIMERMKLQGSQKDELVYMLEHLRLKDLHRTASYEQIIICLCIYVRRKWKDPNFQWMNYSIVKEYGVSERMLITVLVNLCAYYSNRVPLPVEHCTNGEYRNL